MTIFRLMSLLTLTMLLPGALHAQPVKVAIRDDKPQSTDEATPIDPVKHIHAFGQPNFALRLRGDNKALHLGYIFTVFKVDGQTLYPNAAQNHNQPLPKSSTGKVRDGFFSSAQFNQVRVTQSVEIVPSKPASAGAQRKLDTVLVRYTMENLDTQPHSIGLRVGCNSFLGNNMGALFAAPNFPGQILDGVELTGAKVPSHLQVMQQANLQDPGLSAYFTFLQGSGEKPGRVLLTNAHVGAPDNWSIPAAKANGNSATILFWDPRDLKPKAKREAVYAFGLNVASSFAHDGNMHVDLGGSFEPGKLFTVSAFVADPSPGQALTLELPPGLERAEGKEVQPVPPASDDGGSLVLWKARVVRTGEYRVSIHSNTGVTQTKIVTVTAN